MVGVKPCFCTPRVKPHATAPRWSDNPDALGCPKHRPTKQYCRVHHNGFYGVCEPCSYQGREAKLEAQMQQMDVLLGLVDRLLQLKLQQIDPVSSADIN